MNGEVCKRNHCLWCKLGKVLLMIGGLNWGLVGVGMLMGKAPDALNVVHMLLGSMPTAEAVVYVLVGVAAVMRIFHCGCKKCSSCTCVAGTSSASGNM